MFKKILWIVVLGSTFVFNLNAKEADKKTEVEKARCRINVHYIHKSGASFNEEFNLHLKSKDACDKAAKKHETNFNPAVIEKVSVTHQWE